MGTNATKRPATLMDVAKHAGVSRVTASVVINGARSNVNVSAETRRRLQQAALDLDYRPNVAARSLRGRSTNVIGFYTPRGLVSTHDPFFSEIINGLGTGCGDRGKSFRIFGIWPPRTADEDYSEIMGAQVDGLVVFMAPDDPLVARLASAPFPVVAVVDAIPEFPSVTAGDREGFRLVAGYLVEKGHRRVIYSGSPHNLMNEAESTARRSASFHAAAAELGLEVHDARQEYDSENSQHILGASEIKLITASTAPPTAVVCAGDGLAFDLISQCQRLGIRVPEDLAIVGFDGCPMHMAFPTRLTTIHADWTNVVRTAVSVILDLCEGKEVPPETIMPAELIEGDTA